MLTSSFVLLGGYAAVEALPPLRTPAGAVEGFMGAGAEGEWTAAWDLQCHEMRARVPQHEYAVAMSARHPAGFPPFRVEPVDVRFSGQAYEVEVVLTVGRRIDRAVFTVVRESGDYRVCGVAAGPGGD